MSSQFTPMDLRCFLLKRLFRLVMGWVISFVLVAENPPAGDLQPNRPPLTLAQTTIQVEALAMLFQVVDQLQGYVERRDLTSIHNEDLTLTAAVNELLRRPAALDPARASAFKTNVTVFSQRVGDLHLAGDLKRQARAETAMKAVLQALEQVKACFPDPVVASARQRADAFTCPIHREVIGHRLDPCLKCGSPLEQAVRILSFGSGTPAPPTVLASVRTTSPLSVGQPVSAALQLQRATGEPILATDLIESHTRKIHLLIADESLTDYQHEHPEPTRTAGEYSFTFTPRKPGSYRIWADIRPYPLGLQQYAVTDIPATTTGEPLATSRVQLKTNVAGFNYELILPPGEIEAGRSATVRLKITQGDGQGVTQLEPLMEAFAHLVGFFEDRQTVLHLHPKGLPILDPNERGGPELEFQIFSMKPGYVRLFAQVQIAGQSHFAPFMIEIKPAGSLPPPPPVAREMSPFNLVERSGRPVTQEDLAGRIVVFHLMFTGCSFGTGGVMQRMSDLQQHTASMPEVLLVSLTVDPLSDTPSVLTEFARAHRADPDRWLFLTGGRTDIRRLVQTSFFPPPPDAVQRVQSDFVGLDTLTLVDPHGHILESFEGLNPDSVNQLVAQIEKLRRQKPDR